MSELLSVIIPTYNPDRQRLKQTLLALRKQSLPSHFWELIIINNNSTNNFERDLSLSWHPNCKIISEPKQGLTYARLKGFNESRGELIVMVDDDNLLDADYLSTTKEIFKKYPVVGIAGGKSIPLFEVTPPEWLKEFYSNLALRDLGDDVVINTWQNIYPDSAPIGAGMAIRRAALVSYTEKAASDAMVKDRTSNTLTSGGDNEIVIFILKSGWQVGYFPELILEHIIPQGKMQVNYLARLLHDTNKSWLELLEKHGVNPWAKIHRFSVIPRKIKAYFKYRAWKNQVNFIKWKGACGMFEGMAEPV